MLIESSDYYNQLLIKHKKHGALIDSNILLLYTIGSYNINRIESFKRTVKYSLQDFYTIENIINYFDKIITTPHILTEVSNLSNQLAKDEKYNFYNLFYDKLKILDEHNITLVNAMEGIGFRKYGLTDSVISVLAYEKYLVITDDFPLTHHLQTIGLDVINFTHFRTQSYFD